MSLCKESTFLLITLAFCLAACQNTHDKNATEQSDSLSHTTTPFHTKEDLQQVFKVKGLQSWVKEMKKTYPQFSVTHFDSSEKHTFSDSSERYTAKDWQVFKSS